jgi:predicted nucleic acid-binding protein
VTLVDTNVWIDVLKADAQWAPWSLKQLMAARERGPLIVNIIIMAELYSHDAGPKVIDGFLADLRAQWQALPKGSARLAAQAFAQYRLRRGSRTGVLPDFFIGAHAQESGLILLTRDAARYRSYFPTVQLICP